MDLDATRHEVELAWPTFLPDGRRYLFVGRSEESDKTGLFLASLDAPGRTFLVNVLSSVDYSGGYLFYQREGILMAHPFDVDTGRLTGEVFSVVQNVVYNAGNGRAAFSVSETGTLAYLSGDATNVAAGRTLAIFDRSGKASRPVGPAGSYIGAALSPDGRRAVVTIDSNQSARTLSLLDIERGLLTAFNVENVLVQNAVWDPEGSSIVFGALRDSKNGVYRRSAGGGATTDEKLFSSSEPVVPSGFSPDGAQLLMTIGGGSRQRIWVLPLTGNGQPVEASPGATTAQLHAVFSPDGKWIAYTSGPTPQDSEVYVQPYPADDRRIQISSGGGRHPHWTPDSRHVMYRSIDDAIRSVELTPDGRTLRASAPVTLFTQKRQAGNSWSFSVEKTAQKFLLILPPDTPEAETPAPLTMIVNWVANIKRP
jgi:WD40 repeat protein